MDLMQCIDGSPTARAVQFHAFTIVRMGQAAKDCPVYRIISKLRLWLMFRQELEAFARHEERVRQKEES
jgi:hypothetical protein